MRKCGSCTVCCTLTAVPELDKPIGMTCVHCEQGCRIYAGRPSSCETYACAWLTGHFDAAARPDRSGVLVEEHPLIVAVLLRPDLTRHDIPSSILRELEGYVAAGRPVIASGQFARIPVGMTPGEAKARMMRTIGA
jgi:hypothetical protein